MMHRSLAGRSWCIPFLEAQNAECRHGGGCMCVCDAPGATRISCFFVRMRKKTSSLVGSMSRMAARDLSESDLINAAYCCVRVPSRLERIGMPRTERMLRGRSFLVIFRRTAQSRTDGAFVLTIVVDDQEALDALVFVDALQCIVHFGLASTCTLVNLSSTADTYLRHGYGTCR